MSRIYFLASFLLKNSWRTTHYILQWVILGIFAGIIFDPRWRPYSTDYVVLGKSIFSIIMGVLVTSQLSRVHYNAQISVLFSRISRRWYYLTSVIISTLITLFFSFALDIHLLALAKVAPQTLFSLSMLSLCLLTAFLTVVMAHLFSVYIIPDYLLRLLGPVVIGLGAIPDWYTALPFDVSYTRFLGLIIPPIGGLIDNILEGRFYQAVGYPLFYSVLILLVGICLFERRSLTDLNYS